MYANIQLWNINNASDKSDHLAYLKDRAHNINMLSFILVALSPLFVLHVVTSNLPVWSPNNAFVSAVLSCYLAFSW